jgi:hypothetical protein
MASTSQSLPHTHTLGDTEEKESHHEKNGIKSIPEQRLSHDRAMDGEDHSFEKGVPSLSIDYTDWNGDDDPDNPYNCTKPLPPRFSPTVVLTRLSRDRVHRQAILSCCGTRAIRFRRVRLSDLQGSSH